MAFAAQTSYQRVGEFRLAPGDSASFGGHTFTLVDQVLEDTPAAAIQKAHIQIDGGQVYAPALQLYKARGDNVATPSVPDRPHAGHLPDPPQAVARPPTTT